MEPKTISASSIEAFEHCEAGYKATFIEKVPPLSLGRQAGSLGSACHAALEYWVNTEQYKKPWPTVGDRRTAMKVVWESVYFDFFSERSYFDEGLKLVRDWVDRTVFDGRTVLSTELKEHFLLPTSRGNLEVTYIWDRCDEILNPMDSNLQIIEVVDYKTVIQPISSSDLKNRIQPRLYALAAAIKYKQASEIWVTYDLLRYTPVSVRFSREDNIVTWNYLKAVAERIYNSTGEDETLNPNCRYCPRKSVCSTLLTHHKAGGVLKVGDSFAGLIDQRVDVKSAMDGLSALLTELDELIILQAEEKNIHEYNTGNTSLSISATSRRTVDNEEVKKIIGPEIMLEYGKIGVLDIDKMFKSDDRLTNGQKQALKDLITRSFGSVRITTKPNQVWK